MAEETNSIIHKEKPLLSFGIIADVQYADINDGYNYSKTKKRYYRNGLNILREAVDDWSKPTHHPEISFILNLGDLIDGCNKTHDISQLALDRTLAEFDKFKGPVHHSWGNHDFYNFSRDQLLETKLNSKLATEKSKLYAESEQIKGETFQKDGEIQSKDIDNDFDEQRIYYDFSPHAGVRVVMVDSYDISMLGYDAEHPNYKKAEKLLKEHNPNAELNSPIGLEDRDVRWVQYNGGISDTQLAWLDGVLKKADENKEIVIVASHPPLSGPDPYIVCWNDRQVMDIMHKYTCVAAILVGHGHATQISKDEHGIVQYMFYGVVEIKPGITGYATAHVFNDRIDIVGQGWVDDLTIPLPHPIHHGKS